MARMNGHRGTDEGDSTAASTSIQHVPSSSSGKPVVRLLCPSLKRGLASRASPNHAGVVWGELGWLRPFCSTQSSEREEQLSPPPSKKTTFSIRNLLDGPPLLSTWVEGEPVGYLFTYIYFSTFPFLFQNQNCVCFVLWLQLQTLCPPGDLNAV